jgi:hypothetical protein
VSNTDGFPELNDLGDEHGYGDKFVFVAILYDLFYQAVLFGLRYVYAREKVTRNVLEERYVVGGKLRDIDVV